MSATIELSAALVRALERHETEAHAIGGRELVDQGDALALIDPADPDPFWNRMASVRWPGDATDFDHRLDQAITFFAARSRRAHIWPTVTGDEPPDLVARLVANGFVDTGNGLLMARETATPLPDVPRTSDVDLDLVRAGAELQALAEIARVLAEAFTTHGERDAVEDSREEAEIDATADAVVADLARVVTDPRVAFVLARVDGTPAAVAKLTGGSGLAYLSSIGTRPAFRRRGLAALVTRAALLEGRRVGGALAYLGVFEGNAGAVDLYSRLGFAVVGRPVPDLLLVG